MWEIMIKSFLVLKECFTYICDTTNPTNLLNNHEARTFNADVSFGVLAACRRPYNHSMGLIILHKIQG